MKYLPAGLSVLIANPCYAVSMEVSHTINALIVVALYLLFCGWFIWRYKKRTAQNLLNKNQVNADASMRDEKSILVAYASQTGNAEQLAQKTAESLKTTGLTVEIHQLSAIDIAMLQSFTRALFIVSTTGEGDAPDNARDFLSKVMHKDANSPNLKYGILALGDASYTHYCGFGHTLDAWLQHTHAMPLFDIVEVDRNDDGALRHWQYQLGVLAQNTEMADWKTPDYQHWKLTSRIQLNKGSVGAPVYHLSLSTQKKNMRWQTGDIAEVGPRNSPQSVDIFLNHFKLDGSVTIKSGSMTFAEALLDKLLPHDEAGFQDLADMNLTSMDAEAILLALKTLPHREYSIASIPQDGGLELLIRQTHYADGRLGIGSGWLTEYAAIGSDIALRIRKNTAFHLPFADIPLILIGNGTGIAGLRAHLKARVASRQSNNWLIFGERNAEYDFYFKDELYGWHNQGLLTKFETAFSRDQAERIYVQDIVKSAVADIKKWVKDGAAIYVCGSATGMAPAVHSVLLEALGEATLSALTTSGRYRRDVY
jgi:sulfite reductase (NADPH) flavoprotein alpha-component